MKTEALVWTGTAVYFAVIGVLYLALSGDPAGATVLLIGAPFGGLIAGTLRRAHELHPDLASDRGDGDADHALGAVGTYKTDSIRPLALAVGFVAIWLGLVIGLWMTGAGLALVASQVALMTRDADG